MDSGESQLWLYLVSWICLFCLSTFSSLAEAATLSVSRLKILHLCKTSRAARLILRVLDEPEKMLSVLLILNNVANIANSALVSYISLMIFADWNLSIIMGVFSFLIIMFSELLPKTIATYYPDKTSLLCAYPLYFFITILYPLVYFLQMLVNISFKILKLKKNKENELDPSELISFFKTNKSIADPQKDVMISILHLEKQEVEELMLPKGKFFSLDINMPLEKLEEIFKTSDETYYSIFEGEADNIIGVATGADLVKYFASTEKGKESLRACLQEPVFIPHGSKLVENISMFFDQTKGVKVAFVVDEYGNIEGLISRELIINNILGALNINRKETIGTEHSDGSYVLFGNASLFDINKKFDLDFPTEYSKTLSGFLIEEIGGFPSGKFCVRYANYMIEVLELNSNMILYVILKKNIV